MRITPVVISLVFYLLFFWPILNPYKTFWESDVYTKHYPTQEYLRRSILQEHKFPFWTERIYLGFPIYADIESAYLNPVNVVTVLLFGAFTSFKIIHFTSYMIGAYALYLLLKRKGIGILPFTASVLVYYFSFFHLNRLVHYNLISITMLFPLNVLLLDLFVERTNKKYIYAQAGMLAYSIYWGHPQSTVLLVMLLTLYLFVFGISLSFANKLKYLIFTIGLTACLALPQLIPSFRLFSESARTTPESGSIDYTQGSLAPELSVVLLYPYIYSTWGYYYGKDINVEYSYTELYAYVGIVAFVLSVVAAVLYKKSRIFKFFYSTVILFLVFGYVRYIPLIGTFTLGVLSLARYWPRAVILMVFGLALLVAEIINNIQKNANRENPNFLKMLYLFIPAAFLTLIHLLNTNEPILNKVHQSFVNYRFDVLLKRDILLWVSLIAATILLIFAKLPVRLHSLLLEVLKAPVFQRFSRKNILSPYSLIPLLIVLLMFLDYKYYGRDVLSLRIQRLNPDTGIYPEEYTAQKRVLQEKDLVNGAKPLLHSAYTPYGYTHNQFISYKYIDFFAKNKLGNSTKRSFVSKDLRNDLDLERLKGYGFTYIETETQTYTLRNPSKLDITKEEIEGEFLTKEEGNIKFTFVSDSEFWLDTTLKYDPYWKVQVNNKVVEPKVWDELFMSIPVDKGTNVVEFKYIPYDLVYGSILGVVFSVIIIVVLKRRVSFK